MDCQQGYSRSKTENLPLPIELELSWKIKRFSCFFITFLECTLNLGHFEKKKYEPHSSSISKVIDSGKTGLLICIKGLVSENS